MSGLIHVGAYDGSEYVRTRRPLILIEPQADAFAELFRNFGKRRTATLFNIACGAAAETREMFVASNRPSSSLLAPKEHIRLHGDCTFEEREWVSVTTLDRLLASLDLSRFDELVIDTQGYELEVLRGARKTLRGIDRMRIEVNTAEVFEGCPLVGDIDAHLAPLGFTRTDTDLYSEGGMGAWGDAIYERTAK